MAPEYKALMLQLLTGVIPVLLLIIAAIGATVVSRLKALQSAMELQQTITDAKRKEIIDGQAQVLESVQNGAANKLARRVLVAENLHAGMKEAQSVLHTDDERVQERE